MAIEHLKVNISETLSTCILSQNSEPIVKLFIGLTNI